MKGVINPTENVMKSNKNVKSKTSGKQSRSTKPAATSVKEASPHQEGSKQQAVLDLLRRPEGTTIPTIMKATGWQQHSVRGFLAGVVRKKLGLNLVSKKTDGRRLYRVAAAGPAPSQTKGRRKIRS